MAALERFLHADNDGLPVLIRAGLAHVQFETIHPFLDGNGRVGRLLVTLLLCHAGVLRQPLLYLSLYFKQNRSTYYDLLNHVRALAIGRRGSPSSSKECGELTAEGAVVTSRRVCRRCSRQTVCCHRYEQGGRRVGSALRVQRSAEGIAASCPCPASVSAFVSLLSMIHRCLGDGAACQARSSLVKSRESAATGCSSTTDIFPFVGRSEEPRTIVM